MLLVVPSTTIIETVLCGDGNQGSTLGYEPNSFGEWKEQPKHKESPLNLTGDADHWNHREDDDDFYSQPQALFKAMSVEQKKLLFENTARAMGERLTPKTGQK